MIRENTPHFIDYQSGRRGALQYDVASLLYDAKADLPEKFRQELIEIYLTHLGEFVEIDGAQFYKYFYGFVLMRIMQAFGAYGYLSIVKKKKHFFKSVPFALDNLALILNKNLPVLDALPELRSVYEHLVEDTSLREMKHG